MPQPFDQLPSSLRAHARSMRLTAHDVPALLVHPDPDREMKAPVVLWMHGRTVNKELDPGRYTRWMRAGIGACAVDLPGHGERFDKALQTPTSAWDVLTQMVSEIDPLIESLRELDVYDLSRMAIGGMSLGGMVTLARLTRPHDFRCSAVEATTGSWSAQREREMFRGRVPGETRALEPIMNLDGWREIPLLAIHSRKDEWVKFSGQETFIEALRRHYTNPSLIDFVVYDETGAPAEHVGFGRLSADAKDRQTAFLKRWLIDTA